MSKFEPLAELVDEKECWCLNEKPGHKLKNLFMGDEQLQLRSNDGDDDEERKSVLPLKQCLPTGLPMQNRPASDKYPVSRGGEAGRFKYCCASK